MIRSIARRIYRRALDPLAPGCEHENVTWRPESDATVSERNPSRISVAVVATCARCQRQWRNTVHAPCDLPAEIASQSEQLARQSKRILLAEKQLRAVRSALGGTEQPLGSTVAALAAAIGRIGTAVGADGGSLASIVAGVEEQAAWLESARRSCVHDWRAIVAENSMSGTYLHCSRCGQDREVASRQDEPCDSLGDDNLPPSVVVEIVES